MNLHQYYMKHYTKKSVALSTFRLNVKRGMTLEEAMVTRRRELKKAYAKGDSEYMRFLEIAKQNNVSTNVFYHRVQMGWPLERAATQPKRIRRDKPKPTDAYIPTKNDKVMIKEIRLLINAGVPIRKKRYVDYIKKHPELFPELGVKS